MGFVRKRKDTAFEGVSGLKKACGGLVEQDCAIGM